MMLMTLTCNIRCCDLLLINAKMLLMEPTMAWNTNLYPFAVVTSTVISLNTNHYLYNCRHISNRFYLRIQYSQFRLCIESLARTKVIISLSTFQIKSITLRDYILNFIGKMSETLLNVYLDFVVEHGAGGLLTGSDACQLLDRCDGWIDVTLRKRVHLTRDVFKSFARLCHYCCIVAANTLWKLLFYLKK